MDIVMTSDLSPVHTGDYSRRIRRLSPKPATVTEFGNSRRFWRQIVAESATIVSSVDRLLEVISACISSEPGLIWTNMQKDGRPGKGAAI